MRWRELIAQSTDIDALDAALAAGYPWKADVNAAEGEGVKVLAVEILGVETGAAPRVDENPRGGADAPRINGILLAKPVAIRDEPA